MKTMRYLGLAVLALVGLGVAAPVWAELKVAVFDANEVMSNANAAKQATGQMEAKVKAAQARIAKLEEPLLAKQRQLREQAAVMVPEKAQTAQAEFAKELAAFRREAAGIQEGLESEHNKLRKELADGVRKVVTQLAAERQLDLILPKGLVFHSSAAVPDLTAEVLTRTNALLK